MSNTKRQTVRVYTKAVDEATRIVEQIVSVFENVDLGKDRVKSSAFMASLERWAASGDPIPVIWSHAWDDPFAHIGPVLEAKELGPGDPLLVGTPIADLGGLWVRYKVDEAPFADQVFTLLKTRRVREASFAYDVIRQKTNADGTTDLIELDLIEVGPTLKGMNPMTELLSVKNLSGLLAAELVKVGVDADVADTAAKAVADQAAAPVPPAPAVATGTKAVVALAGSLEETADAYFRAALDYAVVESLGRGGLYALHPEGTYPDEQRAVFMVEGWDDPWGEGAYFEFRFATDDEGDLMVTDAVEVTIEGVVAAKAVGERRTLKALVDGGHQATAQEWALRSIDGSHAHKSIGSTDASSVQAVEVGTFAANGDDHDRSKGKAAEDPQGKAAEDPESGSRPGPGTPAPAQALAEFDVIELGP